MAGFCWRLLAVFSLIFIAPMRLRGQDAAGDRLLALDPIVTPSLAPSSSSSLIAPVWIPPPTSTKAYPVATGTIGLQRLLFSQLIRSAGIIFSGRVTSIGRAPSSPGQAQASTAVTFQVEHAMRGASLGHSLTIHEWAGLWSSGERYRVGEHVLLFLYSPGKLGLTSPVAGAMGRYAVDSEGRIVLHRQHLATPVADTTLGGKIVVPYADFVQALRRLGGEE
jgi:hypothetical protein